MFVSQANINECQINRSTYRTSKCEMFRFFFSFASVPCRKKEKTLANSTYLHLAFSNIHNIININSIVLNVYLIHNVDSIQYFFLLFLPIKTIELKIFCLTLAAAAFFICSTMKTIFHRKRINHMENLISALTLKMYTIQTRARTRA